MNSSRNSAFPRTEALFVSLLALAALAVVSMLAISAAFAEERYVAGHVDITLRSGPDRKYRIRRILKRGTPVEVLDRRGDGYSLVLSPEGTRGWVLSRYLVKGAAASQPAATPESAKDPNRQPAAGDASIALGEEQSTEAGESSTVATAEPASGEDAEPPGADSTPLETPAGGRESGSAGDLVAEEEQAVLEETLVTEPELGIERASGPVTDRSAARPSFGSGPSPLPAIGEKLNALMKEIRKIEERLDDTKPVPEEVARIREGITALRQEITGHLPAYQAEADDEGTDTGGIERWMLVGAGIFVGGMLLGILLTRVDWRRRRSPGGGLRLDF